MTAQIFDTQLAYYQKRGLIWHDSLKRKQINNVWGITSDAPLSAGTVLCHVPNALLLQPEPERYPKEASQTAKFVHCTAQQFQENPNDLRFSSLQTLDEFRESASHFMPTESLDLLAKMHPALGQYVTNANTQNQKLLEGLRSFDQDIEPSNYIFALLNYQSRAIGNKGLVPIADCFNHHAQYGAPFIVDDTGVTLKALRDYEAGEQIYMTYGRLDIFRHATSYNYYDPNDAHFVMLGPRYRKVISSKEEQAFVQLASKSYQINAMRLGTAISYTLDDARLFINQNGPSEDLLTLAKFAEDSKLAPTEQWLNQMVERLSQANKAKDFTIKALPKPYRRFHRVLLKEIELLGSK